MSERRMFTQKITESDAFLCLPISTQAYYFHLCMNADDDGFVKNPKMVARMIGASEDDCRLLCAKKFVLPFESGVIVIKHWRMHNLLRKDRYKETEYLEEKNDLYIKENGAYTLDKTQGKKLLTTNWQPNDNQLAPQDRLGKDSIESSFNNKEIIYRSSDDDQNTIIEQKTGQKQDEISKVDYISSLFEKIWRLYPRKVKKEQAKKTWKRKLINCKTNELVLEKSKNIAKLLNNHIKSWQEEKRTMEYIPHFSSWLNGEIPDKEG